MKDKHFLQWIHGRMIHKHGENPNVDYLHKLRAIIADTDPEKETRNICSSPSKEDEQAYWDQTKGE